MYNYKWFKKFFSFNLFTKYRYIKRYHDIFIKKSYTILTFFLILSAFYKLFIITSLLLFIICCIFLIESYLILRQYQNTKYVKIIKIVWKPLKYFIGIAITIYVLGDVNTYLYLQLSENPKNYPTAVTALTSIFSLLTIFSIFTIIFYFASLFLFFKKDNFLIVIGRVIPAFTIVIILFFSSSFSESYVKNNLAKKIIRHTVFYQNNTTCKNLDSNISISFTDENNTVLIYDEKYNTFIKRPCN